MRPGAIAKRDGGELKDTRPEGRGVKLTRWASRPVKSVRSRGLGHHAIGNAIPVRDRETAASSVSILGRIWRPVFVCVARRRKQFFLKAAAAATARDGLRWCREEGGGESGSEGQDWMVCRSLTKLANGTRNWSKTAG